MKIEEFINQVASLFEETDASKFAADTKFKELDEWSSLIALSILAMVDMEYDITLEGVDIRNSNTIQDLYNIVSKKA